MSLISALVEKYIGPVLVIGGGIDAPREWERVRHLPFKCIISANQHAFKLDGCKPDFIVAKDHWHSELRGPNDERVDMEPILRQYGAPIISRYYWGDYRLPHWDVNGNTGHYALVVGVLLGGHPTIAIGYDGFQKGVHFWEPEAQNVNRGAPLEKFTRKLPNIRAAVLEAVVRPISGPLTSVFRKYDPEETYGTRRIPPIVARYRRMEGYKVRAVKPFYMPFCTRCQIPEGAEFYMSAQEYAQVAHLGYIEPLGSAPTVLSHHRYDHIRMKQMYFGTVGGNGKVC